MYASRLIGARMDLEALGFEERALRCETPHGGVFSDVDMVACLEYRKNF